MIETSTAETLCLVGCGNMGGALLAGWVAGGVDPALITVVDPRPPATLVAVRHIPTVVYDGTCSGILVLALKPNLFTAVAPSLKPLIGRDTLVISVMATTKLGTLRDWFPEAKSVVRAVPNLPASIGLGATSLVADHDSDTTRARAEALFKTSGTVDWLDDERLCDAATALSGCGPAYLFRFVDALAGAASALGMPQNQAQALAIQTILGAATLLARGNESPSALARRVASPGGITVEGLKVLDENAALDTLIGRTLAAAASKSIELTG